MSKSLMKAAVVTAMLYACEARVLPDVVSTPSSEGTAPAELLGDLYSARHAMAAGFPVQIGEMVLIGYDDRGLEPVYVVEGSLPVPVSALVGEMRVLRPA